MSGQTVVISVLADASNFSKGMKAVGAGLGKLGIGAAAAVAGLAVGAAKMGKELLSAGENASTSNARIGQVAKSMGLFGKQTDAVTKRLVAYAEQGARITGVDQNQIKMTQAKLLTFKELAKTAGEVGGQFDRATAASVDMAAAGFGSAEQNAVQLGKALNDPVKGITALTRSGITFTDSEKAQIAAMVKHGQIGKAQAKILAAIETQVGGTAAATANMSDKIKVAGSQMKESLGAKLLPLLDLFGNWFVSVLPKATAFLGPVLDQIVGFVSAFFAANNGASGLAGQVVGLVRGFTPLGILFKALQGIMPQLLAAFSQIGATLQTGLGAILPVLMPLLDSLASIVGALIASLLPPLVQVFGAVMAAVTALLPPIAQLVQVVLAALAPILAAVVPLFGQLGDLVAALLPVLVAILKPVIAVVSALIGALAPALAAVIRVLAAVVGAVVKAITWFLQLVTGSEQAKAGALAVWGTILSFFAGIPNKVAGWFKSAASWLISAGRNIVSGLWSGISSGYDWIVGKIRGWVSNVIDFIKGAFGIHSPSTVMAEMGRYMVLGLAGGISGNLGVVHRAWAGVGDLTLDVSGGSARRGLYIAPGAITVQALNPNAEIGRMVVSAIRDYEGAGGLL